MDELRMKKISDYVDEVSQDLIQLSKNIHNNPELGGEEFKALKWQKELL